MMSNMPFNAMGQADNFSQMHSMDRMSHGRGVGGHDIMDQMSRSGMGAQGSDIIGMGRGGTGQDMMRAPPAFDRMSRGWFLVFKTRNRFQM